MASPLNPGVLRSALRRLPQDELSRLFARVVDMKSDPAAPEGSSCLPISFPNALVNLVTVAMHIVTLHRYQGAVLNPEDVGKLVSQLRVCRAHGHVLCRASSRLAAVIHEIEKIASMNRHADKDLNTQTPMMSTGMSSTHLPTKKFGWSDWSSALQDHLSADSSQPSIVLQIHKSRLILKSALPAEALAQVFSGVGWRSTGNPPPLHESMLDAYEIRGLGPHP
jgi:hypothetical protein